MLSVIPESIAQKKEIAEMIANVIEIPAVSNLFWTSFHDLFLWNVLCTIASFVLKNNHIQEYVSLYKRSSQIKNRTVSNY